MHVSFTLLVLSSGIINSNNESRIIYIVVYDGYIAYLAKYFTDSMKTKMMERSYCTAMSDMEFR